MESAHIKDVLAHMRVVCHPRDRISWQRILMLVEKVGPAKARQIYDAVIQEKKGHLGFIEKIFPPAIEKHLGPVKLLYQDISGQNPTVRKLGEMILQYYTPIMHKKFDDYPKRIRDLEQLILIMERYGKLTDFLTDMALEPPNTSANDVMDTGFSQEDRLTLSTIHSAKGLEWHTVFIIWALDGRFPSIYAMEDEEALEEERRLMYVAATRAQETLYFVYPNNIYDRNESVVLNRPSRFLEDLEDDILEKMSVGSSMGWSYDDF